MLSRYRPRGLTVEGSEHPVLLDAGADQTGQDPVGLARLHGYYTPALTLFGSRGLVLLLHGWEGCSHSVCNLITTDTLNRAGYAVFRLNVRDHGPRRHLDPYALNPGFFMGTIFDEIVVATQHIAEMAGELPFYIVGASMGGNQALRLAIRHTQTPFHNLAKVVAINPAINPQRCAAALDARPPYLRYFRRRWLASLLAKQRLFPDHYDFTPLRKIPRIQEMTAWVLEHYGEQFGGYRTLEDYFRGYAVLGDAFHDLAVPTTIITSADDRIVPVEDFYALTPHPLLHLEVHDMGGHVGYVNLFPLQHTLPRLMLAALQRSETKL